MNTKFHEFIKNFKAMSKNLISILALSVLIACGSKDNQEKTEDVNPHSKEQMQKDITAMEKELFSSNGTIADEDKAMKMIALYTDFVGLFPDDPNCPKYLFLASDIAGAINKPKIRVQNYTKILENYPSYDKNGSVEYLLAMTYDADLDQREDAKKHYENVIKTGEDSNLVRDATIRMQTIDSLSYSQWMEKLVSQPQPAEWGHR